MPLRLCAVGVGSLFTLKVYCKGYAKTHSVRSCGCRCRDRYARHAVPVFGLFHPRQPSVFHSFDSTAMTLYRRGELAPPICRKMAGTASVPGKAIESSAVPCVYQCRPSNKGAGGVISRIDRTDVGLARCKGCERFCRCLWGIIRPRPALGRTGGAGASNWCGAAALSGLLVTDQSPATRLSLSSESFAPRAADGVVATLPRAA